MEHDTIAKLFSKVLSSGTLNRNLIEIIQKAYDCQTNPEENS